MSTFMVEYKLAQSGSVFDSGIKTVKATTANEAEKIVAERLSWLEHTAEIMIVDTVEV